MTLSSGTFSPTADSAVLNVDDLLTALDAGNVTVDTGTGASSETGVITIATDVVDTLAGSGALTFQPADHTVLGANVGSVGELLFQNNVSLTTDVSIGSGNETFALGPSFDLGAQRLTFYGAGEIANAVGTGGITKLYDGTLSIGATANSTYSGSTIVSAGRVEAYAVSSPIVLNGGTLGPGAVGPISGSGTVDVADATLAAGSTALGPNSTFHVGLTPFMSSVVMGKLTVAGTVDLGGAVLAMDAPPSSPSLGPSNTLVDNDGTDAVTGTFAGLPEGAVRELGPYHLQISYVGGDGNDVTLTRRTRLQPRVTLAVSPASVTQGGQVTMTATVTGPPGANTPTGTVAFGNSTIGAPAFGSATLQNGTATLTASLSTVGTTGINLSYSGDSEYNASRASTAFVTVTAPPVAAPPSLPLLSIANARAREGNPPGRRHKLHRHFLVFDLTLSKPSTTAVSVVFHTAAATARPRQDFLARKGILTFKPGQTRLTIDVPVVPDRRKERTEKMTLQLLPTPDATLLRTKATGTIIDDD